VLVLLDDAEEQQAEEDTKAALNRALRQLARARAKTEDLVDAVQRAAHDAIIAEVNRKPSRKPPPDMRRKAAEVALWHLTDWQGAKLTTSYNRDVMWQRVHSFVDRAERITEIQRADHPVKSVAILFGGDMVEGLFNFPTQPFEVDATLFEQWVSVSRLLGEVVQRALGIYETVLVVPEWGNHGRIGSKRVEIGNYRALSMHGDETGRAGYVSKQTFLAYLNRLKAGAYPWPFMDVYSGHRHTHDEMAMSDGIGAWFQTGSTESDNRYARDGMGASARPSQRLHFIDPDKGRVTAQYKVWLD
jgi:hypothetical protein